MTTRATALRPEARPVELTVSYGESDVEAAASRFGVSVCDTEAEAILGRIDDELFELAAAATRGAVELHIAEEVERLAQVHADDVDD
jgi:hypothetical protein